MALTSDATRRSGDVPDSLASIDDVATAAVGPPPDRSDRALPLAEGTVEPGTRLGRYIVLRPLGHGGMGLVVLADDPELDRRVAIKILRPGALAGTSDLGRAERRLQREAQAIARLSHPNVIAVYDVGTCDGGVYLAMEYVAGDSLRAWLRTARRSLDDILRVFIAAGRGLAAAHAAGLVHRDVKPDNVLIGAEGTVKVLDFGLARALADRSTDASSGDGAVDSVAVDETPLLAATMTLVGHVMGTPAYMSPEQALGKPMTPRSDQYSLCISLYEAVVGQRPFAGRGQALQDARERGPVFPAAAKVPRALQRVIERGLAFDPRARFDNIDELLKELTRLRHRRRRTVLWLALASLGSAAASFGWAQAIAPDGDPCATVGELEGWDESRRSSVQSAFTATGSRFAEDAWPKIATQLDAWAEAWSNARRDSCEATLVTNRQSGAVMDLRMSCLDRHRQAFEALVATLGSADLDVVARADDAVARLPAVESCADVDALARLPPMPAEPELREQVEALRQRLAQAAASRHAGRYAHAAEVLADVERGAEDVEYPPVRAEHALEAGRLAAVADDRARAESELRRALAEAERAGYAALRVEVLLDLGFELGFEQKRFGAAEEALAIAEAATAGLGDPLDLHARRRFVAGEILLARDRLVAAREVFSALLEEDTPAIARDVLLERLAASLATSNVEAHNRWREAHAAVLVRYGQHHPRVADVLLGLGRSLMHLRRVDEAEVEYRRALEIRSEVFGENSGKVAEVRANLGVIAIKREDYDLAMRELEWAERVVASDPGSVEFDRATMITNLGIVYSRLGRQEEARAMHHRAIELLERADPDHPRRVVPSINIAATYERDGHDDEAIDWYERAAEILLDQPTMEARAADMESNIAEIYLRRGEIAAARLHFRRALDLYERGPSDHSPQTRQTTRLRLAQLRIDEGHAAEARTEIEKLLAETTIHAHADSSLLHEMRFELARAQWELGEDRKLAKERAKQAVAKLAKNGDVDPRRMQALEQWLRRH